MEGINRSRRLRRRGVGALGAGLFAAWTLACGSGGDVATDFVEEAGVTSGSEGLEADWEEAGTSGEVTIRSVRLSPATAQPGEEIEALVRVDNPSGVEYSLQYEWEVGGHHIQSESAAIELPELRKGEQVRVIVVAEFDGDESEPASATADVHNVAPKIYDLRLSKESRDGNALVAEAWGQDSDGDDVEYEYTWIVNDEASDVRGNRFPTDQLKRDDAIRVRVVATDGFDESEPAESGTIEVANAAPDILSTPPRLGQSGVFSYQVQAVDPDGDTPLEYQLVNGPRGMEMNALSGELTWAPEVDQAGDNPVEIAVNDRRGGSASQMFNVPIVVKSGAGGQAPPAQRR